MSEENELPKYIKGAHFIDAQAYIDKELWSRSLDDYEHSTKFRSRYRELKSCFDGQDLRDTVEYGDMYAAARSCVAFVNDFGGVALYVIATADVKEDVDTTARPSSDEYPPLTKEDMSYNTVTIWPYVYNRNEAWNWGFSSKQLDMIESIEPEEF